MLKANKILDPERVRALMASMQPPGVQHDSKVDFSKRNTRSKVENACTMIVKTACSIPAAAQSWGVSTKKILDYAKANNIPVVHKPWELDAKAKEIIESGSYTQNVPRGLKQRVAYELALKIGLSQACRRLNVCRRGIYYYCERYNLPTPERSERRKR
jgi:hypothetical protein